MKTKQATKPEESRRVYELWVELESYDKTKKYWSPVGCKEHTLEKAKSWLNAGFNIFKEQPNIKYRITETIIWKDTISEVEVATRK